MKNQDGMEQTLEALTTNQITRSGEGARMSLEAALIDAERYRAEVETVNQMTRKPTLAELDAECNELFRTLVQLKQCGLDKNDNPYYVQTLRALRDKTRARLA